MSSDPTIDFVTSYGQLIVFSAVVSGAISALVNYWINLRTFKKQKQIDFLNKKISLYSYLIFQIDNMQLDLRSVKHLPKEEEVDEETRKYTKITFDNIGKAFDIMTKKIEANYYLFKEENLDEWMTAKNLFFHEYGIESMDKIKNMLIEE